MKVDQSESKEKGPGLTSGMQSFSLISLFWLHMSFCQELLNTSFIFALFLPESYNSTKHIGKLLHTLVS